MTQPTFYWHDYETFGADPAVDRPAQFAGIRTDAELNEIPGSALNIYCQPADDYLPQPMATLITGITPQQARQEGLPEAEFIARILAELAAPGTCGVGYNSLRFDDEVTRYTLWRNLHDPYAREWQNGNSRWDLIDVLRMARALRPEGIEWPVYEDGRPSLRLEDLSAANGLAHDQAHDALSDVRATIAMARLLRERQPRLFDYALGLRDKHRVAAMLDVANQRPVLHFSSKISTEHLNTALVAPLCWHPSNKNAVVVFDLSFNPTPLAELPVEEIRRLLYTRTEELAEGEERIALKQIHINRCPMLAPARMLEPAQAERLGISGDRCRRHLAQLRAIVGLADKIRAVFAEPPQPRSVDPDLALYAGFVPDSDRQQLNRLRALSPEELATANYAFQDPRLEELLFRYRARNWPDTLGEDEHERWEEHRRRRLISEPLPGALNFEAYGREIERLAAEYSDQPAKLALLQDLADWGEALYPA